MLVGTPAYMAPEQATGARFVGPAADIHALGAILYQCLTGRPPFDAPDASSLLEKVRFETPSPVRLLRPHCPRDLEVICLKCLRKEPQERYATALDLAGDLRRFRAGEPIVARPAGRVERLVKWVRRKPTAAAAYALAVLVLLFGSLGLGAAALWQRAEGQKQAAEQASDERDRANQDLQKANRRITELLDEVEQRNYDSLVRLALQQALTNNFDQAERLLSQCPDKRRGWEWFHVQKVCRGAERILSGPGAPVRSVDFSGDNRLVVSAAFQDGVRLWDRSTGRLLHHWRLKDGVYESAALSPDGKRAAGVGFYMDPGKGAVVVMHLWDTASGRRVEGFPPTQRRLAQVAFSPDGRWLAGASGSNCVRLWDAVTGKVAHDLPLPRETDTFALSQDSRRLAALTLEGVHVFDLSTFKEVVRLPPADPKPLGVAFDPSSRRLYLLCGKNEVRRWDLGAKESEPVLPATGLPRACIYLRVLPDGKSLVLGRERAVVIHDLKTGNERELVGHAGAVYALTVSRDGRWIASGSADNTVRLWDAIAPQTDRGPVRRVTSAVGFDRLAYSPDGKRIGYTYSGGMFAPKVARVCQRNGVILREWQFSTRSLYGACFAPDLAWLAVIEGDRAVRFRDARTGRNQRLLTSPAPHLLRQLFVSPDGTLLAGCGEKRVTVWDVAGGQVVASLNGFALGEADLLMKSEGRLWFRPDNGAVAYFDADNVVIRDLNSGAVLHRLGGTGTPVHHVAFSKDSRWLATAGGDRTILIWDLKTGRVAQTLRGHTGEVAGTAFHPDGTRLASGARGQGDHTLRLWDLRTGQETWTLERPGQGFLALSFSKDGRRLHWSWNLDLYEASAPYPTPGQDTASSQPPPYFGDHLPITALAFSGDGSRLMTGSGYMGRVRVFDAQGHRIEQFDAPDRYDRVLTFHPDGTRFLRRPHNNPLQVGDTRTGKVLGESRGQKDVVVAEFQPGGSLAATGDIDGFLHLRDTAVGRRSHAIKVDSRPRGSPVRALAFRPDGKVIATAGSDYLVRFWDAMTGKETPLRLAANPGLVDRLAWSSDGKSLATLNTQNEVRVWDATTGRLRVGWVDAGCGQALAWSPDGKHIATAGTEPVVRLRDPASGEVLETLTGFYGAASCLAYSADGKRLAVGAYNGAIKVWERK
jgi:WD40 repeat protein